MALRAAFRASADATLPLTRLALADIRSYAAAELLPDPGLTVVAAPNGTGKTNLLEAIHVAITGRSHRAAVDADLVRHGTPFGRIRLDLGGGTAEGGATIELVVPGAVPPPGVRKRLTVNGVARRASTVSETARSVLFRPEEMHLLVGSPSDRRRFLDGIVAQRDRRAARDLVEAARVLAQRNALLRAIRAEEAPIGSLAFWDEQLAVVGARVMRARLEVLGELRERIGPLHDAVAAPDERGASVRLSYVDALKEAWPQREEAAERIPADDELAAAYRRRIEEVRQKEAWNGVSLVGPQRDDLRAELGARDVAAHASRGQQRTIILAMKLAETDLLGSDGPRPIVLLDDVFSELDPDRAGRLSTLLGDRGQVIVTTADPAALAGRGSSAAALWRIVDGTLERAS
ncbi:MAG TPA: DNA replication and repair protein RecF [Patescibacteria group bacterium]|nr:DNA replication and repair protein RecF [Patescibacteria group bacterium]